jgi:hypothetical protein
VAECPSIPGCVSQGKTKPEALKNIKEALPSAWKSVPNAVCRSLSKLAKWKWLSDALASGHQRPQNRPGI